MDPDLTRSDAESASPQRSARFSPTGDPVPRHPLANERQTVEFALPYSSGSPCPRLRQPFRRRKPAPKRALFMRTAALPCGRPSRTVPKANACTSGRVTKAPPACGSTSTWPDRPTVRRRGRISPRPGSTARYARFATSVVACRAMPGSGRSPLPRGRSAQRSKSAGSGVSSPPASVPVTPFSRPCLARGHQRHWTGQRYRATGLDGPARHALFNRLRREPHRTDPGNCLPEPLGAVPERRPTTSSDHVPMASAASTPSARLAPARRGPRASCQPGSGALTLTVTTSVP